MESMKNFLAKIIMKDKELYLSTRYNIFGRNESLSLGKDIIIFLNKLNINFEEKEDFTHIKISESNKISKNAFIIIQNESTETFEIYNLSKNIILVDKVLLKQYQNYNLKHKSTIMLHNVCLFLTLSKNLVVKNIKQIMDLSNNLIGNNHKGNNNRKIGIGKIVKSEGKLENKVMIDGDDYRIKINTNQNSHNLHFLKTSLEKTSYVIKTENLFIENHNGKAAFKSGHKGNGKILLSSKRKASLPISDKKDIEHENHDIECENGKTDYVISPELTEIVKNSFISDYNGIKIE